MRTFILDGARIERTTAIHCHDAAAVLHYYVRGAAWDGLEGAGFPVSGDMLAVEKRAPRAEYRRRRRLAARVLSRQEAAA